MVTHMTDASPAVEQFGRLPAPADLRPSTCPESARSMQG